jgi:zinc transport system substrate-binding protein
VNAARALVVSLALTLAACGGSCGKGPAAGGKPKVVVSIFPLYDLTRRIAGPDADVTLLLPPGKNEHTFDPTPRDVATVAQARLGVMVGLGLDAWMEKLVKDAAPTARVLKAGERVPTITIKADVLGDEEADAARDGGVEDHDHEKGATDPHVWLDPQRARLIVKQIAEELARTDGAHGPGYRERADAVDASLDALDRELEQRTQALKTKGFITFHGSFGYFADRYKLQILAVIEPYPGSSPDSKYISKVLSTVKAKKVPALFSEPQLDPRPAQILADEGKIPLGVLDPVGGSTPETDSYEKMLRFDVASLEKYLK